MKSFSYSALPFVRLLMPLLIGRLISIFTSLPLFLYCIVFFIITLGLVFIYHSPKFGYNKRWLTGVIIFAALLSAGLINDEPSLFNTALYNQQSIYHAQVKDVIKDDAKKQSLWVKCTLSDSPKQYYFDALVYIKKEDLLSEFLPGDKIIFKSSLAPFSKTQNPFAFEYSDYMGVRNVKGQFFVESKKVFLQGVGSSIKRPFYILRKKAEHKLNQLDLSKEEFGIVSALLLGNKNRLDYNTKTNFSNAGAIHVLSVSGLHVGIIYLLMMNLLGNIGKGFRGTSKVIAVILVLWGYAAITGMSPSVFRATIMFTVFIISKRINHQYNIYHSMGIAAFIILIINPYASIHAGFWLSFLAVASIVYFYPQINGWFYFKSPWAKYTWALVSVSLAAQIGTLPLALYLFGYFPTWFVLSNVLIIPVLPFILIGALIVALFPFSSMIVTLVVGMISSLLSYLNEVTSWISHLPISKLTTLQLKFYQIILLYISIVAFIIWQHLKAGKHLVRTLLFFFAATVSVSVTSFYRYHQQTFTVHQVKGKTVLSLTQKHQSTCWVNDTLSNQEIEYAVTPLFLNQESNRLLQKRIDTIAVHPLLFAKYKILVLNKDVVKEVLNQADIIVLTSKLKKHQIENLLKDISNQQLIFDSSFTKKQSEHYAQELTSNKLQAHFVSIHGAFSLRDEES